MLVEVVVVVVAVDPPLVKGRYKAGGDLTCRMVCDVLLIKARYNGCVAAS